MWKLRREHQSKAKAWSMFSHAFIPFPSYLPLLFTQIFPILPFPSPYSNLFHPTFPFSLLKPFPSYLPLLFTQTFSVLSFPYPYSKLSRPTFPVFLPFLLFTQILAAIPSPSPYSTLFLPALPFSSNLYHSFFSFSSIFVLPLPPLIYFLQPQHNYLKNISSNAFNKSKFIERYVSWV